MRPGRATLYEAAYDALRAAIADKRLPVDAVLLESPIAECLEIGRAPVRRALEMLHEEGHIRRFEGRGFLVGGVAGSRSSPKRIDVAVLNLKPAQASWHSLKSFSWQRIYDTAEHEILSSIPFGTFRVQEAGLCTRFGVSRTVAREVLSKLLSLGIVEKSMGSYWIAGPLTAEVVQNQFEIRKYLEPIALKSSAPGLDSEDLERMLVAIRERQTESSVISMEELSTFEDYLHITCLQGASNRRLLKIIDQNLLSNIANRIFRERFGVVDQSYVLKEHCAVLEPLLADHYEAAAAALVKHLDQEGRRGVANLKVLSVFPEPQVAEYLVPMH